MALKKITYNGDSKVIKRLCEVVNDILDNGSSGHTIIDKDGNTMPPEAGLQFTGATVTDDSVNGKTVVAVPTNVSDFTNDAGYLTSSDVGTAAAKDYTSSVTQNSGDLVTSGAVWSAIDNLPEPMIFKGTLGTGGTISALPAASSANEGFTYKVIEDGTYDSKAAKVGDVFTSNGSEWVLIPSGDETYSDTWRGIQVNGTDLLGNGINTGKLNIKSGSNVTVSGSGNDVTISAQDTTYSDATQSASGLMSASDKTKLDGIASGAEVNVQPDWNEADNTADDYIKNKPTIPTALADLSEDTTHRVVTDTEKTTWSGKVGDNPTFTEAVTRANIASGESFATILGKIKKFFSDLKDLAFIGIDGSNSTKYLRGDGTWQAFPTIPSGSDYVKKVGDTMSGVLDIVKASGSDIMVTMKCSTNNNQIGFGIGSSGVNRGIYDQTLSKWLFYSDGTNVYANGALVPSSGTLATTNQIPTDFVPASTGGAFGGHITINRQDGTTSTEGESALLLGNNIAVGTAKNSSGSLYFWKSNRYVVITPNTLSGNRSIKIPNGDGTLALTSDIPTNNNQLTNGAGYITSSGSCNYATSAGSAAPTAGSIYYLRRDQWWGASETHNANDLDGGITFAYGNHTNTATTGTIVSFTSRRSTSSGGYPFQLQCTYTSDNLYFRRKNGDNNTWGSWREIIHAGNIGSQSVNYANSAGSATDSTKVAKAGDTMTGQLFMNRPSGVDCMFEAKNTTNNTQIGFGIGAGGANRGIYDRAINAWIFHTDGTNVYIYGNKVTSAGDANTVAVRDGSGHLTMNDCICNSVKVRNSSEWLPLRGGGAITCRNVANSAYVQILATAFSVQSSRRYKENIVDMTEEDAEDLLALRVVTFDYKEGIVDGDRTGQKGLIAEEVAEHETFPVTYNQDGEIEGLDYSKFVPQLIKLCQVQQKQIDDLTARLEVLESRMK